MSINLTEHFRGNSIYAQYPMTDSSVTKDIIKTLKRSHNFSYDRPSRAQVRVDLTSVCL
jgi:hypothetical protein